MKTRPQLIMLKGLPGSGKSTWAFAKMREEPFKWDRVNKDDLRAMMHGGRWSKSNEKQILAARDLIVRNALANGRSVIVDDTNLHHKHSIALGQIASEFKANYSEIFFDVPVEECIANDLKRSRSVGEKVIRRMYRDFLKPAPPVYDPPVLAPHAIIVDMDGTLADMGDRNPYDATNCDQDGVKESIADLVFREAKQSIAPYQVIVCSGREDKFRDKTEQWLKDNMIPCDMLLMRETGDNRKDYIVKQELYKDNIEGKYNIKYVLDDRDQVVNMWRDLGLTCLQVAPGDF